MERIAYDFNFVTLQIVFLNLFIYLFIHSFIYLFIYLFIYYFSFFNVDTFSSNSLLI